MPSVSSCWEGAFKHPTIKVLSLPVFKVSGPEPLLQGTISTQHNSQPATHFQALLNSNTSQFAVSHSTSHSTCFQCAR